MRATTTRKKSDRKIMRVKETPAVYKIRVASGNAPRTTRVEETDLDSHIRLPPGVNAEVFTAKLIELVESFKGTVGGGAAAAVALGYNTRNAQHCPTGIFAPSC